MMKKILFVAACAFMVACSGPSKKELLALTDSLRNEAAAKDKQMNDLVSAMAEIDENLETIKETEKIINLNANAGENLNSNMKEKIQSDIAQIHKLLQENKDKVAKLEKMLKNSKVENGKLNKIIEALNAQINEKNAEIAQLQATLEQKNIQIADLNFTVEKQVGKIDSLDTKNKQTTQELNSTTDALNTVYYALGTSKDLKEQKIITKDGLFSKSEIMKKDFNNSYFTKTDIRKFESLPLDVKKAKLISSHPQGSYKLEKEANGTLTLVITNKADFWSVSKYLIVQTY